MKCILVSTCFSVVGLLVWTSPSAAGNPVVGMWQLNQPTVGESSLQITEEAGKLAVQEIGLGNARSKKVTYGNGLLVVHWEAGENLHGYWELTLNKEHTHGKGKTVFTRYPGDFQAGKEHQIEGRTVRVVAGVTIKRSHPAVGMWQLVQPTVGESKLQITEEAGKLAVQEIGLDNARSKKVTYGNGLLVIHWETGGNLHGYWELTLNKEHTHGKGKTVFTRYPDDFQVGKEHKIEGRTNRVVAGVTIERVNANAVGQ